MVETKGGLYADDVRATEQAKMECGEAHFAALAVGESPAEYARASTVDDLFAKIAERQG